MSKAVLISIKSEWTEKIVQGKKTIEVRRTAPKEVPFKAYIYCTKDNKTAFNNHNGNMFLSPKGWQDYSECNGKVIGEFICDKVDKFYCVSVPYQKENNLGYGQFIDNGVYKVNNWHEGIAFERNDNYIDSMLNNNDLKKMCLTAQELFDYIGVGKHLYGWHISDLKIYDKPLSLSELGVNHPPQSYMFVEEI